MTAVGSVSRTTTYLFLYDVCGQPVGTVADGIALLSETSYETDASGVTWRVETSTRTAGNLTNALAVTRWAYDPRTGGCVSKTYANGNVTRYLDAETGLYYYGYRFYSPALMRWFTRDPIEERGGLNLYGFCGNNAIISVDPHGHDRYMTTFSLNPLPSHSAQAGAHDAA